MPSAVDMHRTFRLSVLFITLLLVGSGTAPLPAAAQEGQPTLPDIAPREIEIRGTLEISLPSLQRQPLSGFNPPPRIPSISPDRSPYVGSYDQDRSDLPRQLPDPPGLGAQLEQPAPPLRGHLAAGGGRYFTRFTNGQIWLPLSTQEALTVAGDYRGSSGFEPFADNPGVETPFDTFEAQIGLQSRRERVSLNADLEGFYDTYTLYGAEINALNPFAPDVLAQPERTGRHLEGTVDLNTHGPVALELFGRAGGTNYETTVSSDTADPDSLTTERRVQVGGTLSVPVGVSRATFDATFAMAGLGPDGRFDDDVTALDGGLSAEVFSSPTFRLEVGGRFLAASVSPEPRPDLTERWSARFFVPSVELKWTLSAHATLYAKNQPGIDPHPLADLFRENPYLFGAIAVQPSLRTTDAEGGVRLFTGPFQMVASGGYRYVTSYLYFEDAPGMPFDPFASPYDAGLFVPHYASAQIIHAGAEVSLQRMQGIEVSLGATYREGRLTEADTPIPYFAPVTGRAVLSYAFADQRGLIQLTGRFEGARYVDRSETTQVDPFVDLDLEASFDVTPSLGLIVGLRNITSGSLERWQRYPRPPLVLTSGLRVQW